MSKLCRIAIGEDTFVAKPGERILDAALTGGVDLPHECRSGQCGTCLVRVLDGHVIGGDSGVAGSVHACQAVVLSDLCLARDPVPPPTYHQGRVVSLARMSRDVSEVTIATQTPFDWLPGQYAKFAFEGFPARDYSPTVSLDGYDRPGTLRLHVKHVDGGQVSSAIGEEIRVGHSVLIDGPYGAAYARSGNHQRLLLYSGGTGFAPIWSIADAVLRSGDPRPILIVVAARSIHSLYMAQALERMAHCPNVTVIPVVEEPHDLGAHVRTGVSSDFAPTISPGDIVHAAGPPQMVEALQIYARAAGAAFYADPFTPAREAVGSSWLQRATHRLRPATAGRSRRSQSSNHQTAMGARQ